MIIGIGTDLLELYRMETALLGAGFKKRVFTAKESEQGGTKTSFFAGNFAVKEAFSKALGTGIRGFELSEVEVLRDDLGKPYINLYGRADGLVKKLEVSRIHVSISNTEEHALAFVILEK